MAFFLGKKSRRFSQECRKKLSELGLEFLTNVRYNGVMTFTTKYQNWPEASAVDLSDVALESDALDAAVDLKTVIGFFRALDTTDAPASRDWASAASDLETLVADLEELADELRARQRQEDAQ